MNVQALAVYKSNPGTKVIPIPVAARPRIDVSKPPAHRQSYLK